MKIFLISGKARSGKDTFATSLQKILEKKNYKVCRLQVGAYIKYYAEKYFGWDGKEETKPRQLLQTLGTEIIRKQINPMFHVNRLIEDIKVLSNFYDVAIVADIREPKEIEEPKKVFKDIVTIKMTRPNFINELSETEKKHYTEIAMDNYDDYDYEVINDKTIEDLDKVAENIIKKEVK